MAEIDLSDYAQINMANWDSRVAFHAQGYDLEDFEDPDHISNVVRFDLPLLGDIADLRGVHLQCHIGSDTLSLARLGAKMSGLDFSGPALAVARDLAARHQQAIEYVESDVYAALDVLPRESFDFVFTGIGALCWLPDVERWADIVASLLKPGGFLFMREGHPVLWSLADPREDGLLVVEFPYFENAGTVFTEATTYVEHEGELSSPTIVSFNHGLAEIFNALWRAGMKVSVFEEHRSLPWNPLGDAMEEYMPGEFRLRSQAERLPLSYTLRANRPTTPQR